MFYSRPLLEQRIREEQFRSYRTGSHCSVVLFNPFQLVSERYKSRKKAMNSLIKLLDQETRETDIKGWWDGNRVAVLLLDTSLENGSLFVDKLVSKIQENGLSRTGLIRKSSFEIFAFPNMHLINNASEDDKEGEHSNGPGNNLNQNCLNVRSMELSNQGFPPTDGLRKYQKLMKRGLDIVLSVTGLIILSPLFALCALLIKLDSPGPVFYRQTRVGKGGRHFTFLKFRSMNHNVDEQTHKNHVKNLMNGVAGLSSDGRSSERSYKLLEDDRVTRVGKFLRKGSIDELPQLINVLKGDMSLVGPRPHPVYEAEQYDLWHSHRLDVTSGITGLGQVYGRFNTEYEDVYRMDLRYLKKRNLFLDLKILLKTFPAVLSRRGSR